MCGVCKMNINGKCIKYSTALSYDKSRKTYRKCAACKAYITDFEKAVRPLLKSGKRVFTKEERIIILGRSK